MATWDEILVYLAFTFGSFIFSVSCNILCLTSQEREDPAKAAPCWGNSLLRNQFQSLGFDYLVILDFLPVGVKRSIRFASLAGPRLKLGRNTNKIGEKYRNKRYSIHKFIFYHLTKVESIVLYLTPTYISKKSFIVHRQHRQHC